MELLAEDAIMISTGHSEDGCVDLSSALPTNLYFTICDELSNDSQDFLAISPNNITTQIKQEPKVGINQTPIQYRIVRNGLTNNNMNPTPTSAAVTLRAVSENTNVRTTTMDATNLLPSAVQLPSGCEIYLVKEYIDSDCSDMLISEDCEETATPTNRVALNNSATQTASKITSVSFTPKVIKTEPGTQSQVLNNHVISSKIEKATGTAASNYKRRDEKRRATHNEVERRRRDKINSWIFKLKEMLPSEQSTCNLVFKSKINGKNIGNNHSSNNLSTASSNILTATPTQFEIVDQAQQQQQPQFQRNGNNSRSPPSDSKSQILIKACEYIKHMQEEVKSLRECLMENEKLRSSNQRLQNELNKLKLNERRRIIEQQHQQISIDNTNIIDSNDDFTLTLCTNNNGHLDDVATSTLFASNPTSPTSIALIGGGSRKTSISVPYTKRELIISDYVD